MANLNEGKKEKGRKEPKGNEAVRSMASYLLHLDHLDLEFWTARLSYWFPDHFETSCDGDHSFLSFNKSSAKKEQMHYECSSNPTCGHLIEKWYEET